MKTIMIVFFCFLLLFQTVTFGNFQTVDAQFMSKDGINQNKFMPDYTRTIFGDWTEGAVPDQTFRTVVRDMVSEGIITLDRHPQIQPPSESEPVMPWISTMTSYWVDGQVSDREFTNAVGFIIEQGILTLDKKLEMIHSTPPIIDNIIHQKFFIDKYADFLLRLAEEREVDLAKTRNCSNTPMCPVIILFNSTNYFGENVPFKITIRGSSFDTLDNEFFTFYLCTDSNPCDETVDTVSGEALMNGGYELQAFKISDSPGLMGVGSWVYEGNFNEFVGSIPSDVKVYLPYEGTVNGIRVGHFDSSRSEEVLDNNSAGQITAQSTINDFKMILDRTSYRPDEDAVITIDSSYFDTTNGLDTIRLYVYACSDSYQFGCGIPNFVMLKETGFNTGIFRGSTCIGGYTVEDEAEIYFVVGTRGIPMISTTVNANFIQSASNIEDNTSISFGKTSYSSIERFILSHNLPATLGEIEDPNSYTGPSYSYPDVVLSSATLTVRTCWSDPITQDISPFSGLNTNYGNVFRYTFLEDGVLIGELKYITSNKIITYEDDGYGNSIAQVSWEANPEKTLKISALTYRPTIPIGEDDHNSVTLNAQSSGIERFKISIDDPRQDLSCVEEISAFLIEGLITSAMYYFGIQGFDTSFKVLQFIHGVNADGWPDNFDEWLDRIQSTDSFGNKIAGTTIGEETNVIFALIYSEYNRTYDPVILFSDSESSFFPCRSSPNTNFESISINYDAVTSYNEEPIYVIYDNRWAVQVPPRYS